MNKPANILIVDDEEVVRLSQLRSLNGAGYRAEAAPCATEALKLMERRPFDLVFLDIRMPDLDGITVLRTIKRQWPECEVVIVTGYPAIATAKEAVRLGAYHYLVKPVGPDEIVKAARAALIHKGWALRAERPAFQSIHSMDGRDLTLAHPTHYARQGGTS